MKQEKEQHLVDAVIQATGQPVDLTVAQQLGYGITAQYKRKNYDDLTARKKFHDSQFGDKKQLLARMESYFTGITKQQSGNMEKKKRLCIRQKEIISIQSKMSTVVIRTTLF